ncbi:hypothetical protein SAMN05216338_1009106 [Bradyrhizobium sp. Rc2d]|nr:hypothetical protein SAMN05216338_1009106 [Bradyrhizobium sp. Rc2d]
MPPGQEGWVSGTRDGCCQEASRGIDGEDVPGRNNPAAQVAGCLKPGDNLPSYEDVLLGGLGRLADHIVLLKCDNDAFVVSRTGRYAQKWLRDTRWDIPMDALRADCASVLREAASNALANSHPHPAAAHCMSDGIVRIYDVLALPTFSRWGGMLVGTYVNQRAAEYNLLDAIYSKTDDALISLSTIRDATGQPGIPRERDRRVCPPLLDGGGLEGSWRRNCRASP